MSHQERTVPELGLDGTETATAAQLHVQQKGA